MALVGYESNNKVSGYHRRWIGWNAIPIACILTGGYYLQCTNFLSLGDMESVVVSPVIHTLIKKGEIKTVSVLARLPSSIVPSCSLNWLNG